MTRNMTDKDITTPTQPGPDDHTPITGEDGASTMRHRSDFGTMDSNVADDPTGEGPTGEVFDTHGRTAVRPGREEVIY